jgi:1-pyrroline-5-carboxylate dehydrogenase
MGAKQSEKASSSFKLTYATMFNPPEELHTRYEDALEALKKNLGRITA